MLVVEQKNQQFSSLPAKELSCSQVKALGSPLAQDIVQLVAREPLYPAVIAKRLRVHEQQGYYHIRKLEGAGIISALRTEGHQGGYARVFSLAEPSFVVKFKELREMEKMPAASPSTYLSPFIRDGTFNAFIVVGSPDPHGPGKARARDGFYGIDLALFFGTKTQYVSEPSVKLDTEATGKDLKKPLILLGGPITNKLVDRINAQMPIRFQQGNIFSSLSKKTYTEDECCLIVRMKNPFANDAHILVVAGKRFSGTRAGILAFLKHFSTLEKGNAVKQNVFCNVVEGIDSDSDGVIDDVEFRE